MPEVRAANPFPGLRPYQDYEASLFFGRKSPAAQIIEKLGSQRFISVVGTSGSGKSSIVNCGVLPTLYAGFYLPRGSRWRVVRTEPGGEPIRRLAERVTAALADRLLDEADSQNGPANRGNGASGRSIGHIEALSEAILRHGEDGLVNLVRQARLPRSDNVLIVVDQFEELFRYKDQHPGPDEARDFVDLLLRAAEDQGEHIYVMLTMRSDFLGDCMLLPGLPEAINDGLFLVPAMNRDERERAVRGPIKVAGAEIDATLVDRILEDIGDELDQLPLLQHALMRTWQKWQSDARQADEIALRHYLATVDKPAGNGARPRPATNGGAPPDSSAAVAEPEKTVIERALDDHAEAVLNSLTPEQQVIARKIFQAITETDDQGRRGRKPRRLGPPAGGEGGGDRQDLAYVTSVPVEQLMPVIEAFRASDRSFLRPEPRQELGSGTVVGEDLHAGSVIDVWHESLIRNWSTLHAWMDDEARDAEIYKGLAREVATGEPSLTRAKLQTAIEWAEDRLADVRPGVKKERPWSPARRRALGLSKAEVAAIEPWTSKYVAETPRRGSFAEVVEFFRKKVRQWAGIRYGVRLATIAIIAALLVFVAAQRNATQDEQRAGRVQLAGALSDPLSSALVLSELRDVPPKDLWVADLFPSAKPRGIDEIIRGVAGAGIPGAALPESSDLGRVRRLGFSPNGETAIVVSVAGSAGRITAWPIDGRGTLDQRYASDYVPPLNARVTASGDIVARFSDGRIGVLEPDRSDWSFASTLSDSARRAIGAADGIGLASDISPDGRHVAVIYHSGTSRWLAVWAAARDATTDSLAMPIRVAPPSTDFIAFSGDGSRIVTLANASATVWDLSSGGMAACTDPTGTETHQGKIERASLDERGKRLVTAGADGSARIWTIGGASGLSCRYDRTLGPHLQSVNNAAFSLDGERVVTVSDDGLARLFDLSTGSIEDIYGHRGPVVDLWFSPDGTSVATADAAGLVLVWSLLDGRRIRSLYAGTDTATVAFSPDGGTIATAAAGGGVRTWAATPVSILEPPRLGESGPESGQDLTTAHDTPVVALAHSMSDEIAVTGAADGSVIVWDLDTRSPIGRRLSAGSGPVLSVAISPDDRRVAAASGTQVLVWSVSALAGDDTAALVVSHEYEVADLAFTADGRLFTAAGDAHVRGWTLGDSAELGLVIPPPSDDWTILVLAADPASARLLVGYMEQCGRLLAIGRGASVDSLWVSTEEPTAECAVAFSRDGHRFATAEERRINIWTTASEEPEATLEYPAGATPDRLAFGPAGQRLVAYDTASSAGLVVWDIQSGVVLERLEPESGAVTGAALGADASLRLWATSASAGVVLWPASFYREALHDFREATTACLTASQRIAFFAEAPGTASEGVDTCEEARTGLAEEMSQ